MELRWQVSHVPTVCSIAGVDGKFYRLQCREQHTVIAVNGNSGMRWSEWQDVPVSPETSGEE